MQRRHYWVVVWLVVGSLRWVTANGETDSSKSANFHGVPASPATTELAHWLVQTHDPQGQPFVVVDKLQAHVFVFSSDGQLLGDAPALVGLTPGDEGVPGLGDLPLSAIRPHERITPAGRFVADLSRNVLGQDILWVDYDQGISMHAVRVTNTQERRLQRLASATVKDNRISYGCINVSAQFWRDVLVPVFTGTQGMVYVLPETRTWRSVFAPE